MRLAAAVVALALTGTAAPAFAGPPYLTNDPAPTDPGNWEIYAFTAGEGRRSMLDADVGVELNYGLVKDVQLTATLPLSFSRESRRGWRSGTGRVELGAKYRFFKDESSRVSAAIFPKAILPTSSLAHGERTRIQLPLWVAKDFTGGTSLFGGVGYTINPAPGSKDFWQAAIAMTRALNRNVSVGAEVTRQSPDTVGATAQTRAGLGSTIRLSSHYGLLFSGGPTWVEHRTGYHLYGALGLFF